MNFRIYKFYTPKFFFQVNLPNISTNNRDPRKSWLYESGMTQWDAGDDPVNFGRTYSFGHEEDFMMFTLRWGTPENPNLE